MSNFFNSTYSQVFYIFFDPLTYWIKNIDFIPAFETKDAANDCFLSLPREKGKKYEIQAVLLEELYADAEENGFVIAIVDNEGNVVEES